MIISASRRTDIPAFYMDWFCLRLQEGFVDAKNPMNPKQIKRISLSPDTVDGIVFWTKNPSSLLVRLDELAPYPYYVQCTITGYGTDIEPFLPSKEKIILPAFMLLAEQIGSERVIWRYDPILLHNDYSVDAHCERFASIAKNLQGYTHHCIISFIDMYVKIEKRMQSLNIRTCTKAEMHNIATAFAAIAKAYQMQLFTCAEQLDLDAYGISHARCVDDRIFSKITGRDMLFKKDKNQRLACGCMQSTDIGAYNTCSNGCVYCYANHSKATVDRNKLAHNRNRSFL